MRLRIDIVIRINTEIDMLMSAEYFEKAENTLFLYTCINILQRNCDIFLLKIFSGDREISSFSRFVCLGKLVCFAR